MKSSSLVDGGGEYRRFEELGAIHAFIYSTPASHCDSTQVKAECRKVGIHSKAKYSPPN